MKKYGNIKVTTLNSKLQTRCIFANAHIQYSINIGESDLKAESPDLKEAE